MLFILKNLFYPVTLNFFLFLILMIGIQNSSSRKKVNLIINETVSLPISFIVGISFISGSLTGAILKINLNDKKD